MSKKEMIQALEELRNEMHNPDMMMEKYDVKKDAYFAWMTGWVMGTLDHILEK